jgi:hypothetical protein
LIQCPLCESRRAGTLTKMEIHALDHAPDWVPRTNVERPRPLSRPTVE